LLSTVLLSPHPDDLALSIGGSMALGLFNNSKALVAFNVSRYSPRQLLPPSEVTAVRRAEDMRYLSRLVRNVIHLNLPDTTCRWSPNLKGGKGSDPVLERGKKEVQDFASKFQLIVAPLALGGHSDHLAVRRAVQSIHSYVVFYEDLPYATSYTYDQIRELAKPAMPFVVDVTKVFEEKIRWLELYSTQFTLQFKRAVMQHAKTVLPGRYGERLWVPPESWDHMSRIARSSASATLSQLE